MSLLMDPPLDAVVTPPTFIAFDCLLVWAGHRSLEDEIDGSAVLPARRLPDDGPEAWALVQQRGYEAWSRRTR
jgi:hypothetical protein